MRGRPLLYQNLGGGVNLLDAPYELKDSEARDARNVVSTLRGAIRKRDGCQVYALSTVGLQSLYGSSSPRMLIAAGGTLMYGVDPGHVAAVVATGLTSNRRWSFINAPTNGGQGPIYGMNGVEARYTNGTAVGTGAWTASAGTLPIGQYLLYANGRVFVAGMTAYTTADPGSTIVASNLRNPRDFAAVTNQAYVLEIDPSDGDLITGLGTAGQMILVFKSDKCWVINNPDTGANRPLSDNIGCVSHETIVETQYGTFFLSKDQGVCRTNGQTVDRVSDLVLPLIQRIPPGSRNLASAAFHDDRYYLSFSVSGTTNDTMLDFDVKTGAWWIHTLGQQDLTRWEQVGGDPGLYGVQANTTTIRKLFVSGVTQDDIPLGGGAGSNFSAYWRGPFHTFQAPYLRKRIREVHFDGSGRIQVGVARDFSIANPLALDRTFPTDFGVFGTNDGSVFGLNDNTTFGGLSTVAEARVLNPGVGRAWSVSFGNQTADAFEVDSYTLAFESRKD